MAAQDDKREKLQKKMLGFPAHTRDAIYDAVYTTSNNQKINVELKTRQIARSCTTKRRITKKTIQDWEDVVIVISEYDRQAKDAICGDTVVMFPEHMKQWRTDRLKSLDKGTPKNLGYNDLESIQGSPHIIEKIRTQVHLNDPHIRKKDIEKGMVLNKGNPRKHFKEIMEKRFGKSTKND